MSEQSESQPTPPAPAQTPGPKDLKKESVWEVYYPKKGLDDNREAIPVASFPMIIYFWPTMITFLVAGILQSSTDMAPGSIGLWATAIWAVNLLVIVTDLDQKKFVITVLVLVLVGLGAWISNLKGWGVVSTVGSWVDKLEVTYSTHTYLIYAAVLWVLFLVGLVQPRFDYWRLEANEFVHYIQPWGRDQSVPRQGSTVTREVPDVLELLLTFGGGTLVIRREGQVVARIEHVPFLGRRMKGIEKLLGSTRVKTVASA